MKKKIIQILTIIFILGIILLVYLFFKDRMYLLRDEDALKEYILSFGIWSIPVFILLQIFQVIAFFIPGEIFQIAGGYIFGPVLGFIFCLVGSIIGGMINFGLGRLLGKNVVASFLSNRNGWIMEKITKFSEDEKHDFKLKRIVFIFYLIPGIPKDVLGYLCGISTISLFWFLVLSTIAKVPAMLLSTIFGHEISNANWKLLIIIAVSVVIVFLLSYFLIKKLQSKKE